jgi:uncharacterized protein YyaL (SSP411 family)
MERESFEDEEVAEALNRDYVAIKVDREERPDIDHIYMAVCQAMTGSGGWPLTVVMTPEKKPFFAGTYFPKRSKYGRNGLMDILAGLAGKWREDRDGITELGSQVVEEMRKIKRSGEPGDWDEALTEKAYSIFERTFDPGYGGFGSAPKFPTSHNLSLLLWYYHKSGNEHALDMVEKTLDAMRRGGIYDHIGFGFSRYSTDQRWLVPHFEKMLYDNALLAMTYIEAFQITGKKEYAETAEQIFAYVLRDMTDRDGGFYSAEDADSEGEEGKFYVWTPAEVKEVLGDADGELYGDLYDITEAGNFEGNSIPNLIGEDFKTFARRKKLPEDEFASRMESWREKLFRHREKRVHPHKDDKILTAWNGLMIMALAKGAKAFSRRDYADAAARAADFILTQMRREDGRLLARYRDSEAAFPAYLDDYAFMAWGLTELFEATMEPRWLEAALELTRDMVKLFWDDEGGGFFFYGSDSEELFMRQKEIYDGALPSGNSAALYAMSKLARYSYDAGLGQKAEELVRAFAGEIAGYPAGYSLFVAAADMANRPGPEIVIAGKAGSPDTEAMLEAVRKRYAPDAILILNPTGEEGEAIRSLCPLAADKASIGGKATAYVCQNLACQSPVDTVEELRELLGQQN